MFDAVLQQFRQQPARSVALLTGAAFLLFLGANPYITPSEARYIEVPRQMLATGDWIVPHINGVPYFEKPPLFYWAQAAVMGLLGTGEFAGRLTTALLSVCLCMLTYATGALLYGRRAGVAAALVLGSSWLGFALSRVAMLDVPVTVCITAVLYCFLRASQPPPQPSPASGRGGIIYAMYIAAALGMLTKGLIAVALPGLIVLIWLAITKRWALLKRMRILTGALLFLAIAAPWHFAAAARYPEFWNFYFINEHVTRFLTDSHHRDQPWWFFFAVLAVGFFPWFPLMMRELWRQQRERDAYKLFLFLWALIPFVFFSLSHSKLIPYIYPIFPPLAVLLAPTLLLAWDRRDRFACITIYAAALTPLLGYAAQFIEPQVSRGSVKPMAEVLAPQLKPGDEVVMYETYRQDLPIYLHRDVTVVNYDGELAFGMSIEPKTRGWMIDDKEFWRRCAARDHRMFVLVDESVWHNQHPPKSCALHEADVGAAPPSRFILLSNEEKP